MAVRDKTLSNIKARWLGILFATLIMGCSLSPSPESFNTLWESYKESDNKDKPQAFIEYKEQKKEMRQIVQRQTAKRNKDYSKRLLLGIIDTTTFIATTTLTPIYTENLLLTPVYMVEDYASYLPIGD